MAEGLKHWQNILITLVPVALATLFFYPVIFQGKTFYAFDILFHYSPWSSLVDNFRPQNTLISDPVNLAYPSFHHFKTWIQQGVFPFWNGSNFCGTPFSPPGHPIQFLLCLLLPVTTAHDLLLWIHLAGSGLCMYLYLREMGLRFTSSLIGSVAWMFNGYVMVWFEFEFVPMMAATLPLTLYLIERWFKRGSFGLFVCLVCTLSLTIGANFAHLLIHQFFFMAFYGMYRWLGRGHVRSSGRVRLKRISGLALAFLLAIFLSANFFAVHFSAWEASQRKGFSFQELFAEVGRLPASYLTTLIFPDFFGSPAQGLCFTPDGGAYWNYNELCIYVGIPTLFMAAVCLISPRRKGVAFFLISALAALTMAMGSLLYYPLARFIPGLNLSTPTRILYIFGFSVAALAGLGADILLDSRGRSRWAHAAVTCVVLMGGLCLTLFVQTTVGLDWVIGESGQLGGLVPREVLGEYFDIFSPAMLKPLLLLCVSFCLVMAVIWMGAEKRRILFLGLMVLLLSYDLISFGLRYNTVSRAEVGFVETGAIRFLKKDRSLFRIVAYGKFLQNSFSPFGFHDVGGYSSFYLERYGDYLHMAQYGLKRPLPERHDRGISFRTFGSPLLDLLNIKYVLLSPDVSVESEKLELLYRGEMNIFFNKAHFPRVFLVPASVVVQDPQEAYRIIGSFTSRDFMEKVVLEALPPEGFLEDEKGELPSDSQVRIISHQPNGIELDVSTSRKGFLVISDSFHPGWKAESDGVEVPVMRANSIMRAVPVEKGSHRVVLRFTPVFLIAGFAVTASGWILLFLCLVICVIRGAKRKRTAP
ncbi:MAG: YfhO family protein [Deltaproteobacteria bacterium]|nr:YfhO family protein [Deltaproteobacteria bacterium]